MSKKKTIKTHKICLTCGKHDYRYTRNLCILCYSRVYKKENPEKEASRAARHHKIRWNERRLKKGLPLDHIFQKKYRFMDGYKYIWMPEHAEARKSGYIQEHRLIMSQHIGRPIDKKETIHHINGIRSDNRIENLELWNSRHPKGQRVEDKIKWCIELLESYGHTVIINSKD